MARHGMPGPSTPLLVAVSGGLDSMTLLHVLMQRGHPCTVLHMDHGLRGEAGPREQAFVRDHCTRMGLPFHTTHAALAGQERPAGVSVQMAARAARSAWFEEMMTRTGVPMIATGHHADDAVETLLLHLLRGTGVNGLAGLRPVSGARIRPLIEVSRKEILDHAVANDIRWVEDPSNAGPTYDRNRIRNELLPLCEAIVPGAGRTLARDVTLFRELSALALRTLDAQMDGVRTPGGIHLAPIRASDHPLLLLTHALSPHPPHPDVVVELLEAIRTRKTGATFIWNATTITVDREELMFHPREEHALEEWTIAEDLVIADGAPVRFLPCRPEEARPPYSMKKVWLDRDRLEFPLVLRPWREGDRMQPMGMRGTKLVSDILIDAKVPRPAKSGVLVLCSAGELVWVVGHRLAEGVQVMPDSRHVIQAEVR